MSRPLLVAGGLVAALVTGLVVHAGSADAAGSTPAAVSLVAPAAGTYGSVIKLTGVLWKYQTTTKIANAQVILQRAPHGKTTWANLNTAKTSATGAFSFSVTQQGAYDYRAYYAGSTVYKAALSALKYPATNQKMVFSTIATSDFEAGQLKATGQVTPAPPTGTVVYFDLWNGKTWGSFASGKTVAGGKVTIVGTRPGSTATYRLRVPARAGLGTGASDSKAFNHFVWRGGFVTPITVLSGSVAIDNSDPTKSTAMMTAGQTTNVRLVQSMKGCTAYRIHVDNALINRSEDLVLRIKEDTEQIGHLALSPAIPAGDLNASGPGDDYWWQIYRPSNGGGVAAAVKIRVLCAN